MEESRKILRHFLFRFLEHKFSGSVFVYPQSLKTCVECGLIIGQIL